MNDSGRGYNGSQDLSSNRGRQRGQSRIETQEGRGRAVARWLSRSSVTYDGSGLARAQLGVQDKTQRIGTGCSG